MIESVILESYKQFFIVFAWGSHFFFVPNDTVLKKKGATY
jgi:hypothetical protein